MELQAEQSASDGELLSWVEQELGGQILSSRQISGGNRCRSWAIRLDEASRAGPVYLRYQPPRLTSAEPYTVWREAEVYRTIGEADVAAPRLLAVHPRHQAIITELVPGRAEYRLLDDIHQRQTIALEFIDELAKLHRHPFSSAALPGYRLGMSMADCVMAELTTWRAMYDETKVAEPLIEFAMEWLFGNVPECNDQPVLVHGDAGPGNFLFENGHLTSLIDWEFAHPGDPMEDLAWFSMRSVMEPVPDFVACIDHYERAVGKPVDLTRLRYHRVLVSARVVIIRHRNVTGLPGNSIVSRALNRRLLVDALAEATGVILPCPQRIEADTTSQTEFYDKVIAAIRDDIVAVTRDPAVVSTAKDSAKVLKYLREVDRLGCHVREGERKGLEQLIGEAVKGLEDGRRRLLGKMESRSIAFDAAVRFFAQLVAHEAQLAALSSGGLAFRRLPELDSFGEKERVI